MLQRPVQAAATQVPKARDVVLVHGLFADGSCWSEVIGRLQAAGLNPHGRAEPVDDAGRGGGSGAAGHRAAGRPDGAGGPFVCRHDRHRSRGRSEGDLAGLCRGAGAPDAGEDSPRSQSAFRRPGLCAGIVWSGDYGQLSEPAFLRDFAGDLPPAQARVLYAVQQPFEQSLLAGETTHAAWRTKPSWYAVSTDDPDRFPTLNASWPEQIGANTTRGRRPAICR